MEVDETRLSIVLFVLELRSSNFHQNLSFKFVVQKMNCKLDMLNFGAVQLLLVIFLAYLNKGIEIHSELDRWM